MNLKSIKTNETQEKWICRIFSIFIFAQPILDLFTSLAKHAGIDFTIGILVRSVFMVACVVFVLFWGHGKQVLGCKIYIVIVSVYCFLFLAWSFYQGGFAHAIGNLKELIKSVYFLYVIVGAYCLYQTVGFTISNKILTGTLMVYLLVIFLAFITGTSFQSYTYASGYNGWYYAANEISSIIAVLSPIGILFGLNLLGKREDRSVWAHGVCIGASVILLFLISFCASFIGTKAVFAAVLLYLILLTFWSLIQWLRTKKRQMLLSTILAMLVILSTIAVFFVSPLKVNLKGYVDIHPIKPEISTEVQSSASPTMFQEVQEVSDETKMVEILSDNKEDVLSTNKVYHFLNRILSNRLEYIKPSIAAFIDGTWTDKLLGVGYVNLTGSAYNIEKAIEMDGLSVFIRHGIFGLILYLVPLLYFFYKTLCFLIRYFNKFFSSIDLCTYLYSIIIGLFLALVTGHTLVAPAVSIFLAVLIVKLMQEMKQYRDRDTEG